MKHIRTNILILLMFTFITGIIYPSVMTLAGYVIFPHKAGGSIIEIDGKPGGSFLTGQLFTGPEYFHGRPSAINYDPSLSGGTNFGPANKKFIDMVKENVRKVKEENSNLSSSIPADLVLSSASGLDPHISLSSALIQVERVAQKRNMTEEKLRELVYRVSEYKFFGDRMVNVLKLNMELDKVSSTR